MFHKPLKFFVQLLGFSSNIPLKRTLEGRIISGKMDEAKYTKQGVGRDLETSR